MDAFENLPEAPDLSGQVMPLGYRPVFVGPYSCVYRGKLQSTGEMVAIKVLNAVEGTALHTMRRKLNRERRTWGALNHPNILPLYGFADDEEMFQPFGALISPHGDASRFLSKHGDSLTVDERFGLWKDVISGVEYLHSHTPLLVHGDLKPRNILIDDSGHARICDFGLVRIFMGEGSTGMTTTTQHTGTERYLAYELVIAGEEAIPTTASDIYAVGCIGLEFIFSQIPYATQKNNYGGMIYVDIRNGVPPAERPTDLASGLETIWLDLERCWEKDPSKRPSANGLKFSLAMDAPVRDGLGPMQIQQMQVHNRLAPPIFSTTASGSGSHDNPGRIGAGDGGPWPTSHPPIQSHAILPPQQGTQAAPFHSHSRSHSLRQAAQQQSYAAPLDSATPRALTFARDRDGWPTVPTPTSLRLGSRPIFPPPLYKDSQATQSPGPGVTGFPTTSSGRGGAGGSGHGTPLASRFPPTSGFGAGPARTPTVLSPIPPLEQAHHGHGQVQQT